MQGWIFVAGYLTTADDIYFHNLIFDENFNLFTTANSFAINQGRVGQYISVPLVILGSAFADEIAARIIYVGLYFLLIFLTFFYLLKIANIKILLVTFTLSISLISIGPENYNHLPPVAYPLLITIPCLLIILLKLFKLKKTIELSHNSWIVVLFYSLLMLFALLMNEFAFIFGSAIFFFELIVSRTKIAPSKIYFLKADFLLLLISVAIYLLFRFNFPSNYDGNSPNGITNLNQIIYTTLSHIFSSTAIPFLTGWQTEVFSRPNPTLAYLASTYPQKIASLIFGSISAFLFFLLIRKKIQFYNVNDTILASVFFAVYVSLPTAITLKYQDWCQKGHCAYIDSRLSYVGLILLITLIIIIFKNRFDVKNLISKILITFSFFLIFFITSFTYLNNQILRDVLQDYSNAWKNAQNLVCLNGGGIDFEGNFMDSIDPKNNIRYHLNFDYKSYWINYMDNFYKRGKCNINS